ncbi:MAG TPA: class I tRNA ligase family protein [Thermoanaerobaculia bacterium]|nr:class I tRNA ligase family protein [Thermoanaerobaculia bacterium]
MFIQRLDPAKFESAYGIKVQELYPWQGVAETPFGSAWAIVPPGGSTKHHTHQEGETFFVARGEGVMRVAEDVTSIRSGDVVFLPPFDHHTLENTSATEDLLFLTVWWEDRRLWADAPAEPAAATAAERVVRTLVTAAPPTPNGDLHLGHLSGPYLAGDVIARFLRLQGVEARYVVGTDDNQSYVKTKGEQIGLGPEETADFLAGEIAKTLAAAEIELDAFTRPNASPFHREIVQAFVRRLYDQGEIVAREAPSPWCERCGIYLYEAHIRGGCPHCGVPTGGNYCEDCSRPNDCIDLIDPTCTHCGTRPVARPFTRLYFPLSRHLGRLRTFWRRTAMNPRLRSLLEQVAEAGLPDVAVTHPADWGIPVPVEGFEDQRIWVWCEMAPRYLAYAREVNDRLGLEGDAASWERFWKSPEASVVQCFGSDNGFFYGALLPAMLQAFDPEIRLPEALVMNEFYLLDGKKFSTSRQHAIWGREMVAEVPADEVRFFLAWSAPEVEATNFTRRAFDETIEREIRQGFGGWLADLGAKVREQYDGEVPATGDWTDDHRRFYARIEQLTAEAIEAYEPRTFSPQRAARVLAELVRSARRFGAAEAGWLRVVARGEERRTGVALELLAAKQLAVLSAPLMPAFAAALWRELGFARPLSEHRLEARPDWVPSGQRIGHPAGALPALPLRREEEATALGRGAA